MSYDFPMQSALSLLMAVSILTAVTAMGAFYVFLVQIELQATLRFDDDEDDVELQENAPDDEDNYVNASGVARASNKEFQAKNGGAKPIGKDSVEGGDDNGEEDGVARRLYLPNHRRAALAAIVIIIAFMTYLLLALSNANIILSWMGMAVVVSLLLRQTIFEEVRRERLDRLAALCSLLLILAMCMNLIVYAHNQHAQGDIYEGKARIVGYDYSSYTQDKEKDTILRTDLEVAWGHAWGCPNSPNTDCQAFVNGALCETKEDDDGDGGQRALNQQQQQRRRRLDNPIVIRNKMSRRRLDDTDIEQQDEVVEEEAAAEGEQEIEEEVEEEVNEVEEAGEEEIDEEVEDATDEELEEENEELEAENEELKEENEELQEELEEYEDYVDEEDEVIEELDEEVVEEEEAYYFDDDYYYDEYWGEQTWDDVWGEYACEDLFASDVDGESFDETVPPGNDEWPFINIYGNCNTCEAFIVDYYSTQHFQEILNYKSAGLKYGILAGLSLIVTAYFTIKESQKNKTTEKEIELLSSSEATAGAMT